MADTRTDIITSVSCAFCAGGHGFNLPHHWGVIPVRRPTRSHIHCTYVSATGKHGTNASSQRCRSRCIFEAVGVNSISVRAFMRNAMHLAGRHWHETVETWRGAVVLNIVEISHLHPALMTIPSASSALEPIEVRFLIDGYCFFDAIFRTIFSETPCYMCLMQRVSAAADGPARRVATIIPCIVSLDNVDG